ncbi:MAG: hypothetical protein ACXQTU_03130 [Candidatus Nezhaarchaeales archaeon]
MRESFDYPILIAIVALGLLIASFSGVEAEKWIPYTPSDDAIHIKWTRNGEVNVTVTMAFPHSGFMVCWGPAFISNGEAKVNVQVMMWTGPAAQVITHKSYMWTLPNDTGIFKLYVNGHLVKTVQLSGINGTSGSTGFDPNLGVIGLTASAVTIIIVLLLKFVFPIF